MKTKQIFSFFLLLVMMIGVQGVWGQALVFYESFGSQTLSSSVTVAAHTGYDNYGGTYAVTGNSSSIRTTTPSISGGTEQYSGASGGNLLFMNSTSATCTFSGISTMGYEVTGISFGWHKAATVSSPINLTGYDYSLKVEYSVDGGTNWTTANLTSWICPTKRDENNDIRQGDGTSFYATAGSVGWYYLTYSLSPIAETAQFCLRFSNASSTARQMRIDDIKFVGNATAPPPPQSVAVTDVQTACGEYTWLDGNTYTTSNNTATYTVPSTNPGDPDTNLTLNLTILPVENVTADTTVNDYEFSWCGTTYTQHGVLPPCTLQTAAGCDSIVTLNLTLNTPCVEPTNFTATLSEDKSKVTLEWAHEYAGATFNITRNGGAFQEGISGTTFVDESGEFGAEELTYVITTVCLLGESDGVSAVVPADIPLPVFADTIAEACGEFTWYGTTFTTTGDYPRTITGGAASGADSTITLHLTINTAPTNEIAASITQGDVYAENGFNIPTTDLAVGEHTYPQTITGGAENGCDSTVILTLTIVERQVVTYDTTVYVCEGPYVWNNQSYDQSGVYNQTFPQIGYDSVVNMTLVIPTELLSARLELLSAPACNGQFGSFSYEITGGYPDAQPGGNYYLLRVGYQGGADYIEDENDVLAISTATISDALAGTYTYFVTDDHGCTATATIVITEPAAKTGEETVTACDSYEWNGQTYNVSNDYPQTLQTAEGCDSAVTLHLTIDQSYNFSYEASIYEGQTYTGYGFTDLATAGEHQLALHTVVGHCDSVINLTLTVIPVEATELLCAGDTTIAVPYGVNAVSATELLLDQPTPLLSETATLVSLTNDAPEQFTAGETYTITWTLTYNEIGSTEPLTLTCTQNVTVQLPPCGAGFTVTDSEGNIYQTTRIGYECWMAENLRATQPSSSECALMGGAAPTTYVYNTPRHSDEAANLSTYGRLYTWYAAVGLPEGSTEAPCTNAEGHIVGLCPDGWYLPTVSDYITIAQDGAAGLIADQGWLDGANGTNNTGFNALPAGCRTANGSYTNMLGNTYFWTSTTESVNQAVNCKLSYSCPDVQFENSNYTNGYSVRCVKE